jgi:hypothetical protein
MKKNVSRRALAALAILTLQGQTPLPKASELHDPPGYKVLVKLRTQPTSVQIYTCKATGGGYAWSGSDPDAIVTNAEHKLTIHHYKGPVWEATDGSIIRGSNARHWRAAQEKAVDWLELTGTGGTRQFAKVLLIHRIDTAGGVPPTQGCDEAHNLEQARVPYSATYVFYVPEN